MTHNQIKIRNLPPRTIYIDREVQQRFSLAVPRSMRNIVLNALMRKFLEQIEKGQIDYTSIL